jgi:hypothetical protein
MQQRKSTSVGYDRIAVFPIFLLYLDLFPAIPIAIGKWQEEIGILVVATLSGIQLKSELVGV